MNRYLNIGLAAGILLALQSCSSAPRYVVRNLSSVPITVVSISQADHTEVVLANASPNAISPPFALPMNDGSWAIRAGSCVHTYVTADWQTYADGARTLTADETAILDRWKRHLGTILSISFSPDGVVRAWVAEGGNSFGREVTAAGFPMTPDSLCDHQVGV